MPFFLINLFRPAFELESSTLTLENHHPLVITDPSSLAPTHNVADHNPHVCVCLPDTALVASIPTSHTVASRTVPTRRPVFRPYLG